MANKAELKEIIRNYVSERMNEQEQMDPVTKAVDALKNVQDEKLLQSLRNITTIKQVGDLLLKTLDFVNAQTPAPDLSRDLAIQVFQGFEPDEEVDAIDMDAEEEETVDEMSTTAGAPAPATKYAFRRKKK